jgi:hypothetical protein
MRKAHSTPFINKINYNIICHPTGDICYFILVVYLTGAGGLLSRSIKLIEADDPTKLGGDLGLIKRETPLRSQ